MSKIFDNSKACQLVEPPSFAHLPIELIEKILAYLKLPDINVASLTCQRWYSAAKHPKSVRRIKLHLSNFAIGSENPLSIIQSSTQIYRALYLNEIDFQNTTENIFNFSFAPYIRELKLENLKKFSVINFTHLLENFQNLTKLKVKKFDLTAKSSDFLGDIFKILFNLDLLRNLEYISIKFYNMNNLNFFKQISVACPRLNTFKYMTIGYHLLQIESNSVRRFIENLTGTIKVLKFSDSFGWHMFPVNSSEVNSFIRKMDRLRQLELTDLEMVLRERYNKLVFIEFFESQNQLRALSINYKYLCAAIFESIINYCRDLTKLSITLTRYVGLENLDYVFYLKHLEDLTILSPFDENFIVELPKFTAHKNNVMKKLVFEEELAIKLDTFVQILENFTFLQKLVFTLPPDIKSWEFVKFYKNLVNLKYVSINVMSSTSGLDRESDDVFKSYNIGNLTKLEYLYIDNNGNGYIPGLKFEYIAKLRNLNELTVRIDKTPSEDQLSEFYGNSATLRSLDLMNSPGIYFSILQDAIKHLRRLRYLFIESCSEENLEILRTNYKYLKINE